MDFMKAGGFVCCDEVFKSKSLIISDHVSKVHTVDQYVKCELCHFLGTIVGVVEHKEVTHAKEESLVCTLVCETCGKGFRNKSTLANHNMIHTVYQCKLCAEDVLGHHAYATHKKYVHGMASKIRKKKLPLVTYVDRNIRI